MKLSVFDVQMFKISDLRGQKRQIPRIDKRNTPDEN